MSVDGYTDRERDISESVAALVMLREQLCGMYSLLVEKAKQQAGQAKQFKEAEDRLRALIGNLPRDPLTLASIARAAERVETSAAEIPGLVRNAVGSVGETAANGLTVAVAAQVASLERAAASASRSAKEYRAAAQGATWQVVLAAVITSLLGLSVMAGLVAWWIPPRGEIEALRAERDQLAASVADLEKRGGRAKLTLCGGRPCIRTDDTKGVYGEPAKGETYRIIKGY